jgi:NACalpha-BTF3-like transcription factor
MNENQTTNVPGPAALDMMVRIVMSQTDMTHDEVISALERTQYNVKQVIREYMTSGAEASGAAVSAPVSTNQLRFSEIRNFMDKSAETFRRNQEMTRIYQQVQEKKKQQAETAAAAAAAADQASKL